MNGNTNEAPIRTAQKLEVTFCKTVHLRDYENETYTGSLSATFNRAMTPEESAVEIAKMQAELEGSIFYTLYKRKQITTPEYHKRIEHINAQLTELGAPTISIKQ